ncbi:M23 family metallopeptidase [Candidatus Saganbacteria bacterium]|nr:M23 family metallopeptidase [Candidatus Saganbacteria bacterium]
MEPASKPCLPAGTARGSKSLITATLVPIPTSGFSRWSIIFFLSLCAFPSSATLNVVAHSEVFQGRCFIVFVSGSPEVESGIVKFNGRAYKLYQYEDGLRAIVGTMPEEKIGVYPVNVEAYLKNGETETFDSSIYVSQFKYPIEKFFLKPSKSKLRAPSIVNNEWASIEALLTKESPKKLWDGLFAKPVPGITTMPFGTREFVNNKPRSRHRGWDMRAAAGTRILAPNSGIVVFADFLKAFGGTVVIDHGQGVNTLYFHFSKVLAKVGQEVSTGDLLGLSGNTGISSGPHLHWGMSVHNIRVEPKQWVTTVMP